MSPTGRTLKWLREHQIEAQVVERRIPRGFTTIDLFGSIDIIALPNRILGIQATSGANHAARESKAAINPKIARWITCGGGFEVWSWRKNAKGRWQRRVTVAKLVMEEHDTYIKLEFTERKT